jgi:hypothetical protein
VPTHPEAKIQKMVAPLVSHFKNRLAPLSKNLARYRVLERQV